MSCQGSRSQEGRRASSRVWGFEITELFGLEEIFLMLSVPTPPPWAGTPSTRTKPHPPCPWASAGWDLASVSPVFTEGRTRKTINLSQQVKGWICCKVLTVPSAEPNQALMHNILWVKHEQRVAAWKSDPTAFLPPVG